MSPFLRLVAYTLFCSVHSRDRIGSGPDSYCAQMKLSAWKIEPIAATPNAHIDIFHAL